MASHWYRCKRFDHRHRVRKPIKHTLRKPDHHSICLLTAVSQMHFIAILRHMV